MKLKTRQITVTAILLAICIVSQFFKNLNVYITVPDHQCCSDFNHGIAPGLGLWHHFKRDHSNHFLFHTGSPIMVATPATFPCIMIGNIILVLAVACSAVNSGKKPVCPYPL